MAAAGVVEESNCNVWRDTDPNALDADAGFRDNIASDDDEDVDDGDTAFNVLVSCVAESREVSRLEDTRLSPLPVVQDWWLALHHNDATRAACALPIPADVCLELSLVDDCDLSSAACSARAGST